MKKAAILLVFVLGLAGCVNPGVVQVSQNTYVIERTDKGGIFGNASAMKADVIKESQDFADSKGMVAVPVTVKESPLQVMRSFASISYTFKLVDKSGADPALAAIKEKCNSDYQNTLAIDPIRPYVPMFAQEATLSQRASTKRPTAAEKGSLEVWDQVATECRSAFINYYAKNGAPPDYVRLMTKGAAEQRSLLMELWAGKITYGQFALRRIAVAEKYKDQEAAVLNAERSRADLRADSQARISIAEQEAQARANAAQQAADAQSSMAATQRMMLQNQQQPKTVVVQPVQPVNPAGSPSNPVRTDCQPGLVGGSVNCRTYSY